MKALLFIIFTFPILLFSQEQYSFQHNNSEREYIIYLPEDLPQDAPLVFVLHGYTSTAGLIMSYCEMNELADSEGFAVCYPQGSRDFGGINHWNAGLNISNSDDVGFLSELALFLQSEHQLNPEHTFTCGFSNGGFMSYTLACERPDVFKAIASVSGTMSGATWNNCNPDQPVPVFQISGLDDQVVPVDGSMTTLGGWGGAPPIETIVNFWVEQNECSETEMEDISSSVTARYHREGLGGNEVWFYPIKSWGHVWPGSLTNNTLGFTASREIWAFFNTVISDIQTNQTDFSKNKDILLYPNPINDYLFIDSDFIGPTNFILYTVDGRPLRSGRLEAAQQAIDFSELPSGNYFLKIENQVIGVFKK